MCIIEVKGRLGRLCSFSLHLEFHIIGFCKTDTNLVKKYYKFKMMLVREGKYLMIIGFLC